MRRDARRPALPTLLPFAARALALLSALTASCARSPTKPAGPGITSGPARAVVFIAADLRGYLGPCGCSERMRGGIARLGEQLAAARRGGDPVFLLDGGDTLFDHGGLGPGEAPLTPQEAPEVERRAQAIAEALRAMRVEARAVGPRDDARGAAFRERLALPDLIPGAPHRFGPGGRLAAVSGADAATLAKGAEEARRGGARWVVGFTPQPMETAQALGEPLAGKLDLLVATDPTHPLAAEESRLVRGSVPVVQLQSKGRTLLRVDLSLGGTDDQRLTLARTGDDVAKESAQIDGRLALLGKEIDAPGLLPARKTLLAAKMDELVARRQRLLAAPPPETASGPSFTARFVPLESSLPSDPALQKLVDRYDQDVGQLNLAWARAHGQDCPLPSAATNGFVGVPVCLGCHEDAGKVWAGTRHAHAYETLEKVGKQFHTACVGCHVVGYGQPGGVCRIDHVERRAHVGCESCHGPGWEHTKDPSPDNIVARPNEARCVGCHTPENSPHFDFAQYLPQILGPGHGRPLH